MSCYHPLKANRHANGVQVLSGDATVYNLRLPCGQCGGCRLDRSREWALRCMHEASLYEFNSFITLTYDDAAVPEDNGLHHRHFQLFMKRLRKHLSSTTVRYYMCGEYGGQFGRPHFHAILFNTAFHDRTVWKKSPSGSILYRSPTLEALWPKGFSSVGDVTFQSCAYVARYIMQKITGDAAVEAYRTVSRETGEIFDRRPEYNRMSNRPGIGSAWFDKFGMTDVFPHDRVVFDGSEVPVPRYYDKLLKRVDPDEYDLIKAARVIDDPKVIEDNTYRRLAVKEIVSDAAVSLLKRKL